MPQLQSAIRKKCLHALLSAYPQLSTEENIAIDVTPSTQEKFGHYQCNSAMKLQKLLKLPPRKIAEEIGYHLQHHSEPPIFEKVEIAGPGFINMTIGSSYLTSAINAIVADERIGIPLAHPNRRIIIDFSSPNIAKEMHVGHLRSTVIGDCLARLFEFLGHDVLRLNHIGDWGTAFGMLIAYMKECAPEVLSGSTETDLTHLVTWYRESKQLFDSDPSFKRRAQQEVVALQGGQEECIRAWQLICAISQKAYREIYDLLDIAITDRGESFYNPMLTSTVADLERKGLITISDGAKCIYLDGFYNREGDPLPLMIQKSDGGYNYATTDIAALRHRLTEERGDQLIYITDAGQCQHFQMVFKVAEMAGYLNRDKVRVDHIPFGLVLNSDGKKFRTRSGGTEKLIDLLLAAVDHAEKILVEREVDLSLSDRKTVAHALGIAAIKYSDLACHRTGDYTFSYERMLRFEGNTAAYLIYSYVRIAGIKRKVALSIEELIGNAAITLKHPTEIALALQLLQFGDTLQQLAEDMLPHRLTEYLYNLAEKFNAFFRDCRVLGSADQNSRLLLCDLVARTMKQGLDILGVNCVERM